MAQPTPEETSALLTRLSQKPGVQSTLILSRSTGAIVRTSGLISTNPENNGTDASLPTSPNASRRSRSSISQSNGTAAGKKNDANAGEEGGLRSAEDVSSLVWAFFGSASSMTEDMMGKEDEVRLLRLRTKRNELVIVPDSKFLLVVIHDTPPA